MSIIQIAPAVRQGSFLVISLSGASGSGKTFSAILLARGLVGPQGRIGFLDTETGRGRFYSDLTSYEYAELTAPFSPDRYIQAIDEFQQHGVDCLIVDSASHEHEGTGGLIEMAEATKRVDYGKWAGPKAKHKKFMNRLLAARMHVILCCRARQPIKEVTTDSGKKEIILDEWRPIQEKSFIYEMSVSVTLRPDGTKLLTKCPAALLPAFGGERDRITTKTGEALAAWVAGGEQVNHAFEALRRKAAQSADLGVAEFRAYWKGLDAADRDALRPHLDNLQDIAKTADEQAAAAKADPGAGNVDSPFAGKIPDQTRKLPRMLDGTINQEDLDWWTGALIDAIAKAPTAGFVEAVLGHNGETLAELDASHPADAQKVRQAASARTGALSQIAA